jgi:hypothetical protein
MKIKAIAIMSFFLFLISAKILDSNEYKVSQIFILEKRELIN